MALTTVNITGTFNFPDATWSQYTKAEFHLSGYDTDTDVVVPKVTTVALGALGELDVDLWGNDDGLRGTVYRVNVVVYEDSGYSREVLRRDLGRIQITGDGPLDIVNLLDSPVSIPGVWYSTITQAEYDAAIEAVADAEAAAASTADDVITVENAKDVTVAAKDAAIVAANSIGVYSDTTLAAAISAGLAAAAEGETFHATGNDVDYIGIYTDVAGASVEAARYPKSEFINSLYKKDKDNASAGSYAEDFALFDLNDLVAINVTDAGTPAYTATKVAGGLQINQTTGSRDILYSTATKVGPKKTRIKHTCVISTGTAASCGLALYDGVNYTLFQYAPYLGRFAAKGTIDTTFVLDGHEPIAPTMTVGMELIVDAEAESATLFLTVSGGAPYVFAFTGIVIGDVYVNQRGSAVQTHSLDVQGISEFFEDSFELAAAPEITQIDRNTLNAAVGLLSTMQRIEPSGWTYTIPNGYSFYNNASSYFSSIDLRPVLSEADPDVSVIHVDVATGADTNSGVATAPLKSLNVAANRVRPKGKVIIKAKGGLYPYANCFRNTLSGAVVQIVSWDGLPVVSSMHDDTLVWALDSGTTYVATQPVGAFSTVFDASNLTADGDYGALELAVDLATCQATPGTWFSTGTSRYVNLFDGRAPDAALRCYVSKVGGATDIYGVYQTLPDHILYMEDLHIEGGDFPYATRMVVTTDTLSCFAKRCTTKYGGANGTNVSSDGLQVWQDCVAAWNGDDGFNYKGSPFGGSSCLGVEINCIGRWNGRDLEGTNNGSTQHGGPVIRVNGLYENNQDRNVHDIDSNGVTGLSWNMGCTAGPSQTGNSQFAAGISGGDLTQMWLDGCTAIGGAFDVEATVAGATVYLFGFTGTGTQSGAGTITNYTP